MNEEFFIVMVGGPPPSVVRKRDPDIQPIKGVAPVVGPTPFCGATPLSTVCIRKVVPFSWTATSKSVADHPGGIREQKCQ